MTYAEIQSRTYYLADADSVSFSVATLTLSLHSATAKVFAKLLAKIGWEVDDTNYTDLNVAKAALVSGQSDYSIATTHVGIGRVEIKDSGGVWHLLTQIDQEMLKRGNAAALAVGESTRTGAYQSATGIPNEYDLMGSSIFLYPTPNFSQAGSLLVYFDRPPLLFDYTTGLFTNGTGSTASSPGIPSLFHDLFCLYMSYEYCLLHKPSRAQGIMSLITVEDHRIDEFYGSRNRDRRVRMSPAMDSNK